MRARRFITNDESRHLFITYYIPRYVGGWLFLGPYGLWAACMLLGNLGRGRLGNVVGRRGWSWCQDAGVQV